MTHRIKLIALDLDGTLVNPDDKVTETNIQAVRRAKEQGIHVVLSTGRSFSQCEDIARDLGRSSYLVTINGGEIYDSNFELVEQNLLDPIHVERLWDIQQRHDIHFWSSTVQGLYSREQPFDPEKIRDYQWLKFGFDVEDEAVRKVVLDELNKNENLEITNSSLTNIEINPAGVNKAAALLKVSKWLGFTMNEVMAVGDSMNDIAMIREAGIGVAMGNAQPKVKEEAAWVTKTNAEDGVAYAIEKILQKEES